MTSLGNLNEHVESLIHDYLSGTISQRDKDELFLWLVKDPQNVAYFNQISDIWLSSSVFQDNQDFNSDEAFMRIKAKINYVNTEAHKSKKLEMRMSWFKVAAILIPVVLISSLITKLLVERPTYAETPFLFEVPYGSKATITLPDSSKVVLNAGSKLSCKEGFGKSHRILNLIGEGYFNVAKNKNLPFVVHAGNLDVKALGTEFNVKAYPEDAKIEAILIHGSIQVSKASEQKGKPVVLLPKQSLVYNKTLNRFELNISPDKDSRLKENPTSDQSMSNLVISNTNIDPIIYTSWKEPSWKIYKLTLSELAVELERKYDVNIQFGNDALKKITFTGTLPDISLEQVLAAIRLISPIEYKIMGKQVRLTENENLIPEYKQYYKNTEQN